MDDNGGHQSSPGGAMESRPPPDRGRTEATNPMEDIIVEDSEGGRSLTRGNDALYASGDSDSRELLDEGGRLTGNGSFSAAVNALFPLGIANVKAGAKHTKGKTVSSATLVTPRVNKSKITSSRGGRGAGLRSSFMSTKIGERLVNTTNFGNEESVSNKKKLNETSDIDSEDSMEDNESEMIGWEEEEEELSAESFEEENIDSRPDYKDPSSNDFVSARDFQARSYTSPTEPAHVDHGIENNAILGSSTNNSENKFGTLSADRSVRFSEELTNPGTPPNYGHETIHRNLESPTGILRNQSVGTKIIGTSRKTQGN